MLPTYRWKILKEIVKLATFLDIINQALDWYTCACEDDGAAHNFF
jgi:hypothetical protein